MSEKPKCAQCGTDLAAGALAGLCPACLLQQGTAPDSAAPGETTPFEPLPVTEVARLFPNLEILELIARGGMGAIYKARQRALDRLVALKILPPQKAGGPAFAERFNREARALARLNHPNIVTVYEFGQVDGLPYFIMEFVDGVNLRQLERSERLSPRQALQIVPQICDALQYAHDEGVVHRDIKPENVLVDRKGRVKIADFGLAKILGQEPADQRLTREGQVMGTPHYMAPEQIERPLEVDHRADIFALGVVFYEMLTGELPLGKFAPPSRKVQVDVRLDEVVLHALEKEPDRRYQQASLVKTDVQSIAQAAPPFLAPSASADPASPPARAPRHSRRARRALQIGLAVCLFVSLLVTVITFLLPQTYLGVARLLLKPPGIPGFDPFVIQTEAARIASRPVLEGVVQQLNLDQRWTGRYGKAPLGPADAVALLGKMIEVHEVRNSYLVEIRCFSEQPAEATEIAKTIAEQYRAVSGGERMSIIDVTSPASFPARPNIPLNIFLGGVLGLFLGALVSGAIFTLPNALHAFNLAVRDRKA